MSSTKDKLSLSAITLQDLEHIYENSKWIPERTFATKEDDEPSKIRMSSLSSIRTLYQAMKTTVDQNSTEEEKLGLLCAHPDLCARASIASNLTECSQEEQARAGLSQLTSIEFELFQKWNSEYRSKFGFPFILAVRNATKYTVLSAIEARVQNSREVEFAACLAQVHKIAWMRLLDKIQVPEDKHGFLTCHVLDTASGTPASGMRIELFRINHDNKKLLLKQFRTNDDGRLEGGPALKGADFQVGTYEWIFYVGDYFSTKSLLPTCGTPFLDQVPIRFGIDDPEEHYHVPLLVSPYGYSTYRGS